MPTLQATGINTGHVITYAHSGNNTRTVPNTYRSFGD